MSNFKALYYAINSYVVNIVYFRTLRACFTRFSITPSNASLSPIFSSVFFFQYSCAILASPSSSSSLETCALSSSSVIPSKASSVVLHKSLALTRSSFGSGTAPFLGLGEASRFDLPSTDVEEALPSPWRKFDADRESEDVRGDVEERFSEGSTSLCCFDAGKISSRSTGTPSDTRNNLLVRDRIQSGGANGGGATSCDQSDADRGVKNIDDSFERAGSVGISRVSDGKRFVIRDSLVERISSALRPSKSGID